MDRTRLITISILVVSVGSIIGYFAYGMPQDNPWDGLSCDEMIDFSGSDEHHLMGNSMHMEFHSYYFDHCSETELGKP